jgi:hypothetical protein
LPWGKSVLASCKAGDLKLIAQKDTGDAWLRCNTCPNFDYCVDCFKKINQVGHKMGHKFNVVGVDYDLPGDLPQVVDKYGRVY